MKKNFMAYAFLGFLLACGAQKSSTAPHLTSDTDEVGGENVEYDLPESQQIAAQRNIVAPPANSLSQGISFLYAINPDYQFKFYNGVYFLDLFDTSTSRIQTVKNRGNVVICYFSAGSYENWRPDASRFPSAALGRNLDGWAGEKWLDYRNSTVVEIMKQRLRLAKQKGCDGVDPDNIDGHLNSTGFSLSASAQYNFLSALSREARSQGLKIGLKNSPETARSLEALFNWVVAEECMRYGECSAYYNSFGKKGKPVFLVEYSGSSSLCAAARSKKAALNLSNEDLTRFYSCH